MDCDAGISQLGILLMHFLDPSTLHIIYLSSSARITIVYCVVC
jgi:hypothetical protein